jgi:hypothetical protein
MDFNHLQQTKNPKYGICKCVQMLDDMEYILEYPIDPQHFDKRIISIQTNYKVTSLSWNERLKMKLDSKARFGIPLCRVVSTPIMRPTLLVDIRKIKESFQMRYKESDKVCYVSTTINLGEKIQVTKEIEEGWDQH